MKHTRWGKLSIFLICITLVSCLPRGPIQIGYASDLTGKNAGIGVQGRNGAEIAVEEINAAGGVADRPVSLLIRDSSGTPEGLMSVDEALIAEKVVALTGHMASWESVTAYPLSEEKHIVLFSPTTSTPELSNKEDYFFRLIPENSRHTQPLVNYALENGLLRAAIIYDLSNQAYTQTYADIFTQQYQQGGGTIVGTVTFNQNENPDLKPLATQLHDMQPDVVLIIASGLNTALLAQHIRLAEWDVQIMTSNWAYTDELLQNGGRAIDGMVMTSHFITTCDTPEYLAFKQKYQTTYGQPPTFAAAMSYETITFLSKALAKTQGQSKGLPEALTQIGSFRGLCEDIFMTKSGDALRTMYLLSVKNGDFILLEEIPPAP